MATEEKVLKGFIKVYGGVTDAIIAPFDNGQRNPYLEGLYAVTIGLPLILAQSRLDEIRRK